MSEYKHPDTGESVSRPVYEAIMEERRRAEELLRKRDAEAANMKAPPELPRQSHADYDHDQSTAPSLTGCLVVIMFFMMIAMAGLVAWMYFNPRGVAPVPAPVVVPTVDLSRLVEPVRQKLAYDPKKAEVVYRAYAGFRDALAGRSGPRVTDTRVLESVLQAFLTDIDAGDVGVPVGKEIDQAVAAHLGIEWGSDDGGEGWEFRQFSDEDRQKLIEVIGAIADAAEGVL